MLSNKRISTGSEECYKQGLDFGDLNFRCVEFREYIRVTSCYIT